MQITESLRNILREIVTEVKLRKNEYITVDHAFYVLLKNRKIRVLLQEAGVDVDELLRGLDYYLDRYIEKVNIEVNPTETLAFHRATERMFNHIQGINKEAADEIDFFVALLDEEGSYTVQLIREFGLEKVDIVENVEETKREKQKDILSEFTTELVSISDKFDDVIGREKEIERGEIFNHEEIWEKLNV